MMRWTALLCCAILSPLRNGCSHVDSRWGHVSCSFLWHSVQLGFWCDRPKYVFPMVAHILGVSEFECLGDLGVRGFFVLPEVVGEFLVYLGIG
jgi:hypothetical protein